jgi:uncharacterized protein YhdP
MDKGLSLQEGRGALRVWTEFKKGAAVGVTADVALDAVDARLGPDLLPLALRRVQGRIGAQWRDGEVEINSQDLVFDTQEGEHWPGGVVRASWRGDAFEAGALTADRLDLQALAQLSQRLPLPEAWRALLSRVQPQGQVNQLKASWQHKPDADMHFSAKGQVRQLTSKHDTLPDSPLFNMPGLQGAQLEFDVTHQGGKASLDILNGSVTLPVGLDEPLVALDEASAQLVWQNKGNALAVQFTQGRVANADLAGEFSGNWKTGEAQARLPGVLDLSATLSRVKMAQVHRYLPDALPADVRAYVRAAVQAGEASRVTVRLRGDLNDMPFDNPALGEFRIVAPVTQVTYAYVAPEPSKGKPAPMATWPALTELNGELVFGAAWSLQRFAAWHENINCGVAVVPCSTPLACKPQPYR